jgi:hypothetical protein
LRAAQAPQRGELVGALVPREPCVSADVLEGDDSAEHQAARREDHPALRRGATVAHQALIAEAIAPHDGGRRDACGGAVMWRATARR